MKQPQDHHHHHLSKTHENKAMKESIVIRTIMNNSLDTIYFKDKNSKLMLSSRAHAALYGCDDPNDVIGTSDFDFFPEEFAKVAFAEEQRIIATGIPSVGNIERLERPDGSVMWLSASKYPLYDEAGTIIGTWGTSRDITSLKEAEENLKFANAQLEEVNRQLKILSCRDSLTGLYNQGQFFVELNRLFALYQREYENDNNVDFSLLFIDIDNFKEINDTYGHLMGDDIIKQIGRIIGAHILPHNACFRYGGDEFAMILEMTSLTKAHEFAETIRLAVSLTPVTYLGHVIRATVSIGVSSFQESCYVNDMMQRADDKLYQSKKAGKNKIS